MAVVAGLNKNIGNVLRDCVLSAVDWTSGKTQSICATDGNIHYSLLCGHDKNSMIFVWTIFWRGQNVLECFRQG